MLDMVCTSQRLSLVLVALVVIATVARSARSDEPPKACIDGTGPGWAALGQNDFLNVNCEPDTWTWNDDRVHCTGKPVGVIRSKKLYVNFELVAQWQHLKSGGNSGIFVWTSESSLADLKPGRLPEGIEVQVLDHGYTEQYEKQT